jgi:aryl-alcohol dehydrogenase-like predicted oxidoreductase
MSLNHYVTVGRSGLRVSPLCLGTMTFGQKTWGTTPEESWRLLDRYIDLGGNFVDTANTYARGWSEKMIGDHLVTQPRKRAKLVLATKFVANLFPGDPNAGGAGRKAIIAQLEESLRRLQTDHVDLYWIHAWDRLTPIEETMRALDDLVRAGKVRYVGFSNAPAWKVTQAHMLAATRGFHPLIAIQVEYSLLERTAEAELLPAADELGLGVMPWSPLKNGILTGKYARADQGKHRPDRAAFALGPLADERTYDIVERASDVARGLGIPTATLALAWLKAQPHVTSTIIGVRSIEQLDANVGALDVRLDAEALRLLDAVSRPRLPFPSELLAMMGRVAYGGTTIDGKEYAATPYAPKDDADRA